MAKKLPSAISLIERLLSTLPAGELPLEGRIYESHTVPDGCEMPYAEVSFTEGPDADSSGYVAVTVRSQVRLEDARDLNRQVGLALASEAEGTRVTYADVFRSADFRSMCLCTRVRVSPEAVRRLPSA